MDGASCMTKSSSAQEARYSYGPWLTCGCRPPKPDAGAGEGKLHSNVVHCQGVAAGPGPFFKLQNKFTRKMTCPAISTMAEMVINLCSGAIADTYCTPVKSE